MTYWGTIVLARAAEPLPLMPGAEKFGHRFHDWRVLGDGWQILETRDWDDPVVLDKVTTDRAAAWETPILAWHVAAEDCAQAHGALPGEDAWTVHLFDTAETDCGLRHRPVPRATTLARFGDLMRAWASGAGLPLSRARLHYALERGEHLDLDARGELFGAFHRVGELVRALGFGDLPAAEPHRLALGAPPFDEIVFPALALAARVKARSRARALRPKHPAEWETEAMCLEADLHLARFGFGPHSPRELADRATWVHAASEAEWRGRPTPPRGSVAAEYVHDWLDAESHLDPEHPLEGPGRRPELP